MDSPALINGGAFTGAGAVPYNLVKIWPFQLNGCQPAGGALGLGGIPFRQGNGTGNFPSRSSFDHRAGGDGTASLEQTVSLGYGRGGRKRRESEDEWAKAGASTSNADGLNDCDGKRLKNRRDEAPGDINKSAEAAAKPQPSEPPEQDYIHVRARRGQATDSHSLAERARREKISERMRILQDMVPGCNRVIGKALILDEIINYIQSLQHQVEGEDALLLQFLSMKVQAVNSRLAPRDRSIPF